MNLANLRIDISSLADTVRAKNLQRYFKTGRGEYGEGDIFIGLTVPQCRKISLKYCSLNLNEIKELLKSKFHEERLIALLILVDNYRKNKAMRKEIFDFYIDNSKCINSWDLVDLSAPEIIGHFLYYFGNEYPVYKILLTNLAKSDDLWSRRIAIISTSYFIKNNHFSETLRISDTLLNDKHDLIHKAVGWMLREVGKKDQALLEKFLKKHYLRMPRTMLRYAIEKFPEDKRQDYLQGRI